MKIFMLTFNKINGKIKTATKITLMRRIYSMGLIEKLQEHYKTNVRYAVKNAFGNFKSNICILLILLILQSMLTMIIFAYHDNSKKNFDLTYENYDWHIALLECTREQVEYLYISEFDYEYRNYPSAYEIVRVTPVKISDELNSERYDVYLKVSGATLIRGYHAFRQQFNNKNFNVVRSPLYFFEANYTFKDFYFFAMQEVNYFIFTVQQGTDKPYVWTFDYENVPFFKQPWMGIASDAVDIDAGVLMSSMVIWAVFSYVILKQIIKSKIDLDKYTYGIYKVLGADVKKQRNILRYEILCLWLITLVPAYLSGLGIYILTYQKVAFNISVIPGTFFTMALVSLVLLVFIVKKPVNIVVKETCVNLIKSGDTSGYVSSPRKSFDIMRKGHSPAVQSLMAIWRMRKYFLSLIFSVAVLLSLFISTMSLADSYNKNLTLEKPQWTLSMRGEYDYEKVISGIGKISGVSKVSLPTNSGEIKIYADKSLEQSEYESVGRKIREWTHLSGCDLTYSNHHTNWTMHVLGITEYARFFRITGVTVFLMVPVMCIYTQANYYFKKRNDMTIYSVIGVEKSLKKKYLINDGIFLAVITLPLSLIITFLCYYAVALCVGILELDFRLTVLNLASLISGNIIVITLMIISPVASNRFQEKFFTLDKKAKRRKSPK